MNACFSSAMKPVPQWRFNPAPADRIARFQQDVWSVFSPMAMHLKAVNLGQGFPNFQAPDFIKRAAVDSIVQRDINQYSPPKGLPRLRQALAAAYTPLFNRPLNADTDIIVTAGANEGFFAICQAYLDPGSEVICFEPFFDQYAPNISTASKMPYPRGIWCWYSALNAGRLAMSGGVMRYCPLVLRPKRSGSVSASLHASSADWTIDMDQLRSLITPQTRMLVLNTPHNPVGKVFNRQELADLAQLAIEHDLMVVSDEVYERLVYDGAEHVRIATLPGMWDRTLTVCSAGKSFCVTGWRVGWLIGPEPLIHRALIAHSRIVFCANSPLQEAVATAVEQSQTNGFFEHQLNEYQKRRDFMVRVFADIGIPVTVPEGSYFILASIDGLTVTDQELAETESAEAQFCLGNVVPKRSRDWKICRWLTVKIGVAAIPPSEFYGAHNAHLAEGFARFCFCKTEETLQAAAERLQRLKDYLPKRS